MKDPIKTIKRSPNVVLRTDGKMVELITKHQIYREYPKQLTKE